MDTLCYGDGSWMPLLYALVAGNILGSALKLGLESFDLGYPLEQLLICWPLADAGQCPARAPVRSVTGSAFAAGDECAPPCRLRAPDCCADQLSGGVQIISSGAFGRAL